MRRLEARSRYGAWLEFVQRTALAVLLAVGVVTAASAQTPRPQLIVAYGDSLSAGYQLRPREGFAPRLEAALRASGRDVRVRNASVSGDTTAQGRARLNWVLAGLRGQRPDLVIVQLGANDMLRGTDPAATRANLDAILGELRRRGYPVLLAGMLASPNLGRRFADAYNPIFPTLAKKHGATLYPFFLRGVAFRRPLLLADQAHPNPAGVNAIVRGILPSVEEALTRRNIAVAPTRKPATR